MNERTTAERTTAAETRLALLALGRGPRAGGRGRFDERAADRTANWTQTLQNGRPTWNQIVRQTDSWARGLEGISKRSLITLQNYY